MFPKPTRAMFDSEIDQTTYLSTGTIAAATLVELVALVPGGEWNNWEYVAFALWWATVLLALLGGSAVYWILIRDEEVHLSNLSPTLLYPVTGILATASAGSVVVNYTDLTPKLAMPVIVVSYLLLGMGERTFDMTFHIVHLLMPSHFQASFWRSLLLPPILHDFSRIKHLKPRKLRHSSSPSVLWQMQHTR